MEVFRIPGDQLPSYESLKRQLLNWASRFSSCCYLDNHGYRLPLSRQECLVAVGERATLRLQSGTALQQLDRFLAAHRGNWVIGHLGFDLKQETEAVPSGHTDYSGFADLHMSVPEMVVKLDREQLTLWADAGTARKAVKNILNATEDFAASPPPVQVQPRMSRADYLDAVSRLRDHIRRGDCYEINFCQEFYAAAADLDPAGLFQALSIASPNPYSAYYRRGDSHLACASPERFLALQGGRLISQPMKGTGRRVAGSDEAAAKEELHSSPKERSENVMVVDLVRNDLSKVCVQGTVQVDELFGVYTFPQVYQMVSTVSGEPRPDVNLGEILRATFPMGSMTGAPKRRVLELTEQYETARRGLYSGALGYIDPDGQFDFNVVIRSILYNAATGYLSYQVGGGITWYSDPELEYEECMLKAAAMQQILGNGRAG